jgi:hypothetical protein
MTHPTTHDRPARWTERASEWLSDEGLTALLALLTVDMFVLPILGSRLGDVAVNLVFTILLFTGLATVASRGVASIVVGVFVVAAAVLNWIAQIRGLPGTPVAAAVSSIVVFAVFTLLVLLRTLSPGPITRRRIEGAVAAYLLMAMTFGFAYEIVELTQPGSLQFGAGAPEVLSQAAGYFSVVTLTTVGFGDVTPTTALTRRLAMLEGLIGQLYPAVIIGWMISSMKRRED